EDEAAATAALNRVKASKNFKQLVKMWQGAQEGGQDRAAMQAAFNDEFDGRGFWAETEEAFDRVEAAAKAQAAEDAEAAAAKKKAQEAAQQNTETESAPDQGEGNESTEGSAAGSGAGDAGA